MPEIAADELRMVATLKEAFRESRIHYPAKATTLADLVEEVVRVHTTMVLVPPELMRMLADAAAARGLRVPSVLAGAEPPLARQDRSRAWGTLTRKVQQVRDVGELIVEIHRLTGLKLHSGSFAQLAQDVRALGKASDVPYLFVREVERAASTPLKLDASASGPKGQAEEPVVPTPEPEPKKTEVPLSAEEERAQLLREELRGRLIDLALDAKIVNPQTDVVERLYGRLKRLAGASRQVAKSLAAIESDYGEVIATFPPPSMPPPASSDGERPSQHPSPDVAASRDSEPPLFVRQFAYRIFHLDWVRERRGPEHGQDALVVSMPSCGYAMAGRGRSIDLGERLETGMTLFFMSDPDSGISAGGRFPAVADARMASERIARTKQGLKGGFQGNVAMKNGYLALIQRLTSGELTPFAYEFARLAGEFGRLDIPAARIRAAAVFFAGNPGRSDLGTPPAQVMDVLSAMRQAGIEAGALTMFRTAQSPRARIRFDAAEGMVTLGHGIDLRVDEGSEGIISELELLWLGTLAAMRDAGFDAQEIDVVRAYHLPLASGLWRNELGTMRNHLRALLHVAHERTGKARSTLLRRTYRAWHAKLPVAGGGVPGSEGSANDDAPVVLAAGMDHAAGMSAAVASATMVGAARTAIV